MLVRILGLLGTLALTRLLVPHDLGVIALGLALLGSVSFLTDVGVAAGLVRERETPSRHLLGAMVAFQLALSLPLAALGAVVGVLTAADDVRSVALMLVSIPIVAVRTPSAVLLERQLQYTTLAAVEVTEVLTFNCVAVVGVAAGGGTEAIAGALLARNLAGSTLMLARGPVGLVSPRWSWPTLRPHLAFGAKYQAIGIVALARDQLLNGGTVAIAGAATLGLWSVALRLLQIPALLFDTLSRVAFPALVRLIDADESGVRVAVRGTRLVGVSAAFILVPLAAASPGLVPALFTAAYADAAAAVPWACAGLMVSGPISVFGTGLLLAEDRGRDLVYAILVQAVVWVAASLALVPWLGVVALGIGWFAGCTTAALITGRFALGSTWDWAAVALPTTAAAACAATLGTLAGSVVDPLALSAVVGGTCGVGVLVGLLTLTDRDTLEDCVRMLKGPLRRGGAEVEIT